VLYFVGRTRGGGVVDRFHVELHHDDGKESRGVDDLGSLPGLAGPNFGFGYEFLETAEDLVVNGHFLYAICTARLVDLEYALIFPTWLIFIGCIT
jgi:hypothetical protein